MEAGDEFNYSFEQSRNDSKKPLLEERILVIHASRAPSVKDSAQHFSNLGHSRHLFLGSDGKALLQTLPFNVGARHLFFEGASEYDRKSIAVELQYPGELTKKEMAAEKQYLRASSLNNSRYGDWHLYPEAQLNALLKIAKTLATHYQITDIVGYEEIANRRFDPGPAFPITQFREKVLGVNERSFVLQEIASTSHLRGQPEDDGSLLSKTMVPAGKPVAITNEFKDWYLVTVVDAADEKPWQIGWVKKEAVRVNTDVGVKVNDDHWLVTEDGRRFQIIEPHRNGYTLRKPNDDPNESLRYIIMHFTTGLKMESTISHFKDENSKVSTHLLIGRDGRVVQFLPFDRIAHHCGDSYWEGDHFINQYSIGIELDNAGLVSHKGGDKWVIRNIEIPTDRIKREWHWKMHKTNLDKGWEIYSPEQLKVALKIVKALKDKYPGMDDILGHDDVNFKNRYDPGPLFPLKVFRRAIFDREEPDCRLYTFDLANTEIYENFNGSKPTIVKHGVKRETLATKSTVEVVDERDGMTLVIVKKSGDGNLQNMKGWVRSSLLPKPEAPLKRQSSKRSRGETDKVADRRKILNAVEFFKQGSAIPTPLMNKAEFKKGYVPRARIQQIDDSNEWALTVILPDKDLGQRGLEGWVRVDDLSPV